MSESKQAVCRWCEKDLIRANGLWQADEGDGRFGAACYYHGSPSLRHEPRPEPSTADVQPTREQQLEEALRGLLNQLPALSCENWHHAKKDRHDGFTPCPVQGRWDIAVKNADAALEAKHGK